MRPRYWLAGLLVLAAAPLLTRAAAPVPVPDKGPLPALTPEKLAERIDELIAAKLEERGVKPSPLADDAEFFRRTNLDIGGRIPGVADLRKFLDDKSSLKRRQAIDAQLNSPLYATNFVNFWRGQMIPQTNNQFAQGFGSQLDGWLHEKLTKNTPYDEMVREIITAQVAGNQMRPGRQGGGGLSPLAFYQANENKPENLAAATSRLFLGVKLECAQCHNHPFAKWKKDQFWQYAAFFSGIQSPQNSGGFVANDAADKREIKIPNGDKVVQARFLDDSEPKWKDSVSTRQTLSEWMTSAENPYFTKAIANRMWAHFFGVGIIDPVDEEGPENPASHPELLNELARQLALHNFDLKYLIKAITYSKAYQRTSSVEGKEAPDRRLFARMSLKGLTAEQLYDSIVLATGIDPSTQASANQFNGFNQGGARAEFVQRFSNSSDKRTEHQTSILQALSLMNGKFISDATSLDRSVTLMGIIDVPFMDTGDKIETLYLASLGRKPTTTERDRLVKFVDKGGPSGDGKKALADVFWALLNSSEFILNH
jgi:hypothetical protein